RAHRRDARPHRCQAPGADQARRNSGQYRARRVGRRGRAAGGAQERPHPPRRARRLSRRAAQAGASAGADAERDAHLACRLPHARGVGAADAARDRHRTRDNKVERFAIDGPRAAATIQKSRWEERLKPAPFAYAKARTLAHAVDLLAQEDARLLAGGQSLIATLNMRLSPPALLVDINGIDGLGGIALKDGQLEIGALTRHSQTERSSH